MRYLATTLTLLLLACGIVFAQGQVTLDQVDGLIGINTIGTGHDIRFHLRYTNNTGFMVAGSTNGLRVYSPDGAVWTPITYDTTGAVGPAEYDQQYFNTFSVTGSGADTVGFGGFRITGSGIINGFNAVVWYIQTEVHSSQDGKTLCLDTAFYEPGGYWLWSIPDDQDIVPEWDGLHCFTIEYDETDVAGDNSESLPDEFELRQNYPNPFNPTTEISFALAERSSYSLTIFNALGREVSKFAGESGPGEVTVRWDGGDHAAGVYIYRLQAGDYTAVRKMVLLK